MRHGFTLVELAIVLVIIGLVAGGILGGQALSRSAELRGVATEYDRYITAVRTFTDQYGMLPGDLTKATTYWGQSANCPGDYTQGTSDGSTCNGNGDGYVFYAGTAAAPTLNEIPRFWQHLSNAELIPGKYNGVTATTTSNYMWGVGKDNAPSSKLVNGHYSALYIHNVSGAFQGSMFRTVYDPYTLVLGGLSTDSWNRRPVLEAEESWHLDTKLDDGRPGRGKVIGWGPCTSSTNGSDLDATYTLDLKGKNCLQFFLQANAGWQ